MITIVKKSVTKLGTDAVVNAANEHLKAGGGVCGTIFREAGYEELEDACDDIMFCKTGSAVVTPAFALDAKIIIHAVGPIWSGGKNQEPQLLYSCYMKSLELAKENECASIGFPLISAGIYGYPMDKAWTKALQACMDFEKRNADLEMKIVFGVLSDDVLMMGYDIMKELEQKQEQQ